MYRILLLCLALSLSVGKTFSQCSETAEPKVLLVGDSWAWFMNTDGTINTVFKNWGHSNYKFVCNSTLAVNGAQTDDFIKPAAEAEILHQLQANPTIEAVHLSIGGNDFLGDWNINMTPGQTDTLISTVFFRLDSIVRFIKSCKPGIKILWSGYCYTDFKEVITNFIAPTSHPFYNTWHGMGDPDFIQINTLQNYVSAKIDSYCLITPNVYYYNANSLMQYEYGQPNPLQGGVTPTGTYAAHTASIPVGHADFPSPMVSMRDYGITKDCYHLSPEGYRYLVGWHAQKFYQKLFMDDLYLLSEAANSGSVSSQGNVSATPFLGEASGEQFATVLSFNTTSMADTTLRKASIFIRRKNLTGGSPVNGTMTVKVKNGNFGSSATVEVADFSATGDGSGTPCLFGAYANDDDWARLDLPSSLYSYINHNGPTQFIITSPGAGKEEFYDSSDPEFAPVLNLAYGTPAGIKEADVTKEFSIYPNPTNGILTIDKHNEVITHMEVTNLVGEVVMAPQMQQNTINISSLQPGMYLLNITTKNGKATQRIVKE